MLTAANVAPLVASRAFGRKMSVPIDGGRTLADGRPILGPSKTWRGLLASWLGTVVAARLLGVDATTATRLSLFAMSGDMIASFLKRRAGVAVHGRSPLLDQLPEALLPLLALRKRLRLSLTDVADVAMAFTTLEEPWSRLLFAMGLRDRPY